MTLQIHNKQVIDFYKQNKHISFEEVNIFMVDMGAKNDAKRLFVAESYE